MGPVDIHGIDLSSDHDRLWLGILQLPIGISIRLIQYRIIALGRPRCALAASGGDDVMIYTPLSDST